MISFRRRAERIAAGRFCAYYDGSASEQTMAALLDTARWSLMRFDDASSTWKNAAGAERLTGLSTDRREGRLELRCAGLNGLYRLRLIGSASGVRDSCDYFFMREWRSEREPYHLYLEGYGEIDYVHLDQDGLPQSISQKFDQKEGLAVCGGLSFSLADTDGTLARIFAPRAAKTLARLAAAVGEDDQLLRVDDARALPQKGALWLDRERIEYDSLQGDTLMTCRRGTLRSAAVRHAAGTMLRSDAPFLEGRAVYVEKADGTRLYGGIISRVTPHADNQACFRVELSDALSALDVDVGRRLGSSAVSPLYLLHGAASSFRLRWIDGMALGGCKPSEAGALVRLRPGFYDITPGRGGRLHICAEIERAICAAHELCAERFVSAELDEDGRLRISLKGVYRVDLLPTESASALTQMGYPAEGLSVRDEGAFTDAGGAPEGLFRFSAGAALKDSHVSANSDVIPIVPDAGEALHSAGGLLRVGDELVAYGGVLRMQHGKSGALASALDADEADDGLTMVDAGGFFAGQMIQIDDEQIMLGDKWGESFSACVRGAGGSVVESHAAGAQVRLADLDLVCGCRRGMYGSTAQAHGAGETIEEMLCSDDLSDPRNPRPCTAGEFIAALLGCGGPARLRRFSLALPPDLLDPEGIARTARSSIFPDTASFLSLMGAGCSYRDELADIARGMGCGLYVNSAARISLGSFAPHLAHDGALRRLRSGDWIGAPALSWCEDGRINRVVISLDRDPLSDKFSRCLVLNDAVEDSRELFRSSEHTLEMEARCFHSCDSPYRPGAADVQFIGLARRCFCWFNRFYSAVEGRLPLAEFGGLGLFDAVSVSLPQAPCGDGARGIDEVLYDVVEIEPDLRDMSLRVVLLERGDARYGGLNIGAEVLSWQASQRILRIVRSEYWPESLSPAQLLKAGDALRIRRRSDGQSAYSQTFALEAVADAWMLQGGLFCADLVLSEAPQPTPQLGDLLVSGPYTAHTSDDSVVGRLLHLADDEGRLGQGEAFVYSY